jgi:hypothetical protein
MPDNQHSSGRDDDFVKAPNRLHNHSHDNPQICSTFLVLVRILSLSSRTMYYPSEGVLAAGSKWTLNELMLY